jgi:small conductance mechanosensitive channel
MNLDQIFDQIQTLVTQWGLQAVGALAVLVIGVAVAKLVRRGVRRSLERSRLDRTVQPFLAGLVYYLLLAVVVIAVLSLFGIESASLIAVLGAAGLAIGLALQGTLSHFASGVMLLLFRPVRVGDYCEVAGTNGTVVEIGMFSSTLRSPDNVLIVVPNSKIYGDVIKNYNGFATRRVDLVVGVSYDDDLQVAVDTARAVLGEDERILGEPEPVVVVGNLGDSAVDLLVRPWCRAADYWPLRWDLTRALKERLEAAGCSIPYPQRDVHVHPLGTGAPAND